MYVCVYIYIYIYIYICVCVCVYILLSSKPTKFLGEMLKFKILKSTFFEWENFCIVGASTANRNGICQEYEEMIN